MPAPPLRQACIAFAFLMVAEFFYAWAWNTVDVLRPFIRDTLHLTLTQAGAGYSAQGAGALVGALTLGQLADRLGRRRILALIMVGYGSLLLAGVIVTTYPQFLMQRLVLGFFMGGIFPVVVGIYVGLFAANVRGRLASLINGIASSAIVALGLASGALAGRDWHSLLLIGGIPPILLAGFAFVLIPRSVDTRVAGATAARLPVAELFAPGLRRRTLLLACLTGLNFFAYQSYSGWLTIYLTDVRHLAVATIGPLVAWQFAGNIAGGFFWGWVGDRFGRRTCALGFFLAAAAIAAYLIVPTVATALTLIGAAYGFTLSASVIWGPWITELYPPHLKSTAASIFNWGRIVSFFAPLITGQIATHFGLTAAMAGASLVFFVAGLVWISLPETAAKRA